MEDEWTAVRRSLIEAGVNGVEDFGRFVNNTQHFRESRFDARAAAPVLLSVLPTLHDPRLVATVARHLQGPWIRELGAYATLEAAFQQWAGAPGETGWVLGDTVAKAATPSDADALVRLAENPAFGSSRACVAEALWRFKAVIDVETVLRRLVSDPDVALMAMTSLQRTIGAAAMIPVLEKLLEGSTTDPVVRRGAQRQLKRIRMKLSI